jgi:hypothetical protein
MEWLAETKKPRVKDGVSKLVLTYNDAFREFVIGYYDKGYSDCWKDENDNKIFISHWMPLPEPPTTNTKD